MRRAASLTVAICVVLACVLVQHHRATRATVGKVEAAVARAPMSSDQVEVGGRTFRVSFRHAAGGLLTTAVATDTRGLNDGTGGIMRSRGGLQLDWVVGTPGAYRVRFVRPDGHQVVIVGSPATQRIRRAMSDLAAGLAA